MIKLVVMLKKHSDISVEEFERHYEEVHAPLGLRLMPSALRYIRKYLDSRGSKASPTVDDAFDVITEVWFASLNDYEQAMSAIRTSAGAAQLIEDEHKLFDRAATRYYLITEERESTVNATDKS